METLPCATYKTLTLLNENSPQSNKLMRSLFALSYCQKAKKLKNCEENFFKQERTERSDASYQIRNMTTTPLQSEPQLMAQGRQTYQWMAICP